MDLDTTFFTSDHHFGHRNIIRYCDRPFDGVRAMDAALVAQWNAVVGPHDRVYHLGDFTLQGRDFARAVFGRLQGDIAVLGYPWHHDRGWVPDAPGRDPDLVSASGHPVEILPPMVVLNLPTAGRYPQGIVLCHFPLAEWDRKYHGGWHLHGHSHGNHHGEGALLDVGVDPFPYQPVSLRRICAHFGAPKS